MQTFRAGFALPLEELRDEVDRLWTSLTAAPPLHGWSTEQPTGRFPAVTMRDCDDAVVIEAESGEEGLLVKAVSNSLP